MAVSLLNRKCIVIGANGYLGRHLVHYLNEAGCGTHAADAQAASASSAASYSRVDVADLRSLLALDWKVDYVYAFAGIAGTYAGFDEFEKFVQVNEIGLLNVLTALRQSGQRPRLVFPSTRLVYEGAEGALAEDAPKKPKTIYAINKLACESILEMYRNVFGIPSTVYRICVPYGNVVGSGYSYGLTGAFIKQAKEKACITLYGDGLLRRTLTHVEDICSNIIAATADERSVNDTFNVPGQAFSLREVAALVAERYQARVEFSQWPPQDLTIESGHTVLDGTKLQRLCGGELRHRFESWIRQAPPV